jgi:cell division septation protein DedD
MFEMFETYGKQITAFIQEAKVLLTELRDENRVLKTEVSELKSQITRIEGSHMLLMEWLAEIDESEAQELADAATLAASEAIAAAAVATEAAAEVIEEVAPIEETIVETETPAPPAPIEEIPAPVGDLTETPVPEESPASPEEVPSAKKKRFLI